MCDYSLSAVKSRPAAVGDKLTTKSFGYGTRGFSASEDATVAVCVLPGTEMAFTKTTVVRLPGVWNEVGYTEQSVDTGHSVAIFRQINKDEAYRHHDALEFPDGSVTLLTDLIEDQTATVLQLPAAPKTADEAKAQERLPMAEHNLPVSG